MRHLLLTLACGAYAQRSEHVVHLSDEKHYVKGECAPPDDVRIENPDLAAPGFNEGDEGTTDGATRLAAAGILSAVVLFLV